MISFDQYLVRLCQTALLPGDIRGNTELILQAIAQARREEIRLVIL